MPLTFQNTHSSLSRGRTTLGHRNHIRQPPRPCLVLHPAQPSLHQAHATLGAIDVNQLSGLVLINLSQWPLRSRNGSPPVTFRLGDAFLHVLLHQKPQVEEGDLGIREFLEMRSTEASWRSWFEQDQIRGLAPYIALIQWIINKNKPRCIFCNKIEENKWIKKPVR